MAERFPSKDLTGEPFNPAIRLYGRRFYEGQTPVEYLAEFLMVFASVKGPSKSAEYSFDLPQDDPIYWPKDRVALKLFTYFPTSRLDTRHDTHNKSYLRALEDIKQRIEVPSKDLDDTLRLLQSLFAGFVGVAKNRTWVTSTFLPACSEFLAREVTWNNPKAPKNKTESPQSWEDISAFFDASTHNFMGRGGELLFLQLAHLFFTKQKTGGSCVLQGEEYEHLYDIDILTLQSVIQDKLRSVLVTAIQPIALLARFIENALPTIRLPERKIGAIRLGWVPVDTLPEAFLFATELRNICQTSLTALEKLDLLQILCIMQVLRSLCFHGARFVDGVPKIKGFAGHYVWICADPDLTARRSIRKFAEASYTAIESLLYCAVRSPELPEGPKEHRTKDLENADDNCFRLFRKLGKEIGLIIPRTGKGQRFILPPHLLRLLVTALLRPGERLRLDRFYERVFAHYGIALGERQLAAALHALDGANADRDYAVAADTAWITEALRRGGFLVELSDAVSIVQNPGTVTDTG